MAADAELVLKAGTYDQDVAGYVAKNSVSYDNGNDTWTVLYNIVAQNVDTGAIYSTVSAALAAANTDQTVIPLINVTEDAAVTIVPAGVILNLNGKYITANNVLAFGNVIDSTQGKGGLKISNSKAEAFTQLQATNTHMPLYDKANGCYRFYEYNLNVIKYQVSGDAIKFGYRVRFADSSAYILLADTENSGVKISVNLSWTEADGDKQEMLYNVRPMTVANYAEQAYAQAVSETEPLKVTKTIEVTITGLSNLGSGAVLTALHSATSETGVTQTFGQIANNYNQYTVS